MHVYVSISIYVVSYKYKIQRDCTRKLSKCLAVGLLGVYIAK